MIFRNQKRFKGQIINNVVNKPVMRKKGTKWIVVSLSALMLLGMGKAATSNNQAHADTEKPQSSQIIQNQATQLSRKLLVTAPTNNNDNKANQPSNPAKVAPANASNKPSSVTAKSQANTDIPQNKPANNSKHNIESSLTDSSQSEDNDYNFDASDKMYDTPKNDYLNDVNNLALDLNGEAIRSQIRLTYGFNQDDPSQPNNGVSAPQINSAVITDLNNNDIGILPLYCQGNSIRGDGMIYPTDNDLYHLNDNQRPNDSVGYQKMIPEAKLIGYLLTAPRNTDFTSFFNRYFYIKNDNGMEIDMPNSEMSTTDNQDTSNPNKVLFPNTGNTGDGVSQSSGGVIDLEYAPQDDTITYTYNGTPVGTWTSTNTGSTNVQDPQLLKMYDSVQQNSAPGMPAKYQISDSTFNNFLNTLFNQATYQRTHTTPGMNYGQHYTIPVILAKQPKRNVIKYMYNEQQVGEWTSPNQGDSDSVDNDLVNVYNNIQSTSAPGLPSKYFIPEGPTYDHPEYTDSNNPLNTFFSIYSNNEDCFDYGKDYTINVDVPYTQLHLKYFENGQPASIPEQTIYGQKGSPINVNLINSLKVPQNYHLQNINTNNNTIFSDNSQEIDVYLANDKTNTVIKKVPTPGPTKYVNVPGPTKTVTKNVPGPTKYIHVPGPTKVVTKDVPGPTKYVTKYITKNVPGPTKYITKNVPGPTKVITHNVVKTVKVPEMIHEPGKTITKYVTKNVPGPVKYITRTIPGPTKVINHDVTKVVKVPGPTQIIHEPGKTITKYVNVPGPLKIEKVPGPTITKIVYTPAPTKVVYKTITKNVPGPTRIKYIHVHCHCKTINHTKIVYVPKVIKEIITPKVHHKRTPVRKAPTVHKIEKRLVKIGTRIKHLNHNAKIKSKPKVTVKNAVSRNNNKRDKLPQTGENNEYTSLITGIIAIMSALSLAGYDFGKKHNSSKTI